MSCIGYYRMPSRFHAIGHFRRHKWLVFSGVLLSGVYVLYECHWGGRRSSPIDNSSFRVLVLVPDPSQGSWFRAFPNTLGWGGRSRCYSILTLITDLSWTCVVQPSPDRPFENRCIHPPNVPDRTNSRSRANAGRTNWSPLFFCNWCCHHEILGIISQQIYLEKIKLGKRRISTVLASHSYTLIIRRPMRRPSSSARSWVIVR